MKIAMRIGISGGRGDNTPWPHPGVPFDVDDEEGAHLCASGMAYPVAELDAPAEMPDVQATADIEVRSTVAAVPKPIVNSPKAAWVDHAVSLGFDRDEAAGMSKADLIAAVKP